MVNVKRSNKRRVESAYTQHHSVQPLHARHSLGSCHPGHAGAGSLYRSAALPVRRAKLQLSRPMSHDQLTYSHSGQPAHAQQPRQQQQAAGSSDGPYTA